MHSLVVLADQPRWNGYYALIFPLYKWRSLLKRHGIKLSITTDKNDSHLKSADTVVIISRVFKEWQSIKSRTPQSEAALIAYLTDLKKTVKKIVWYDRTDSTGSTDFPIIQYVDVFLKNQVLKDVNYYTQNNGAKSVRAWIADSNKLEDHFKIYFPCPADQLYKIKVGWNLGHVNYKLFSSSKVHRLTGNYLFAAPKVYEPSTDRKLDFSLRGNLDYGSINASISAQRNAVISVLKELTNYHGIISGQRVDKPTFMKELAESKICVSPFGWGEICYRDFEIFIAGSLMIKPSVSYMNTYPDIFVENETYIPVLNEMDDLKQKLEEVLSNYSKYTPIAKNGQQAFLNAIADGEAFVQHIKNIIS